MSATGVFLPSYPGEIEPLGHIPRARHRHPISAFGFQDGMDGAFLSLAGVIGSIDQNGEILASGDIAELETLMDLFGSNQYRNTDSPLNEFAPPVFGLNSDAISNEGADSASVKDSEIRLETV